MGRYYYDKKDTKEDCLDIDVFWLNKHHYFQGFKQGGIKWGERSNISIVVNTIGENNYIRFLYKNKTTYNDYDYKFNLLETSCFFGGKRYWFQCGLYTSNVFCGRRVGSLYLPPGASYFGCRHCHNISYDSRNVSNNIVPMWHFYTLDRKIRTLEDEVKIQYRNGRPTKKFRKLEKLRDLQVGAARMINESSDLHFL